MDLFNILTDEDRYKKIILTLCKIKNEYICIYDLDIAVYCRVANCCTCMGAGGPGSIQQSSNMDKNARQRKKIC